MKHLAQEVLNLLRDVGAIPRAEIPQNITYFPRGDADLAFRLGSGCVPCPPTVIQRCRGTLVRDIEASGNYLNVKLSAAQIANRILSNVEDLGIQYGFDNRLAGVSIVVEHTSLNPVYPINVGTFRSSAIGDALAHLLRGYGANVETHFWIEDQSRHLGVVACGLRRLGMTVADLASHATKGDHAIGSVFAATLYRATESVLATDRKLLTQMFPLAGISPEVPEGISSSNLQLTDDQRDEVLAICQLCIKGFGDTLSSTDIRIDRYDFESAYLGGAATSRILSAPEAAEDRPSEASGREWRDHHLNYFLRNAIYYAELLNEATRVISVVSIRQRDVARASARLAENVYPAPKRTVDVVCFGDVHAEDGARDSVKQGRFNSVDALLWAHARELGQPAAVVAAGLKFALLRANPARACKLIGSGATMHRDFLRILQTLETLDNRLASGDSIWSEAMEEDTVQRVNLLKRIAVLPEVLERVLQQTACHYLARYVLDLARDTRKYLQAHGAGGRSLSKRLLIASRLTLVNACKAMGVSIDAFSTRREV
jgi:predicted nucleic acid-binding protein